MRFIVLTAFLLLAPPAVAQQALKVTQLAEFADGLSQPHDAAFSPDGKLIYVTDMRNSRIQVLEAMTLKPLGSFGAGELSYPHDAEFDKSGRLLVADTGNDRVAIYEVKGAQAKLVGELKGLSGSGRCGGRARRPDHRHQYAQRNAQRVSRRQAGTHGRRPGRATTASCATRTMSKPQVTAACTSSIRPITASRCSMPRSSIAAASARKSG